MSNRVMFATAVLCACTLTEGSAQSRAISLTGRPQSALAEPFTMVTGIQEVAPGKVVIADMMEQRLVFGDFAANSVRDVGRKGGGPNEWQFAMSVTPGPNGSAYVTDPSLRRMHVVDASGKIVRGVPFPGTGPVSGAGVVSLNIPRGSDAQGRVYMTGASFVPGQQEQPDSIPIIRWDPRSNRTDTLGMTKNEMQVTQSGGSGNSRVTARAGGAPLAPEIAWVPLRDGRVALVNPNPYRVDFIEVRSTTRRGVPVAYVPIKVGKAERDTARARMASGPRMTMSIGGR